MKIFLNYYKNLKFKSKLVLSFLVASIIPTLFLGIFAYAQSRDFLTNQSIENIDEIATLTTYNINSKLEEYAKLINLISSNVKFRDYINGDLEYASNYDYVEYFFSNYLSINKDILDIYIFTNNQNIVDNNLIYDMTLLEGLKWKDIAYSDDLIFYNRNQKIACFKNISNSTSKLNFDTIIFLTIDSDILFEKLSEINLESYYIEIKDVESNKIYLFEKNIDDIALEESFLITKTIDISDWVINMYVPKNQLIFSAEPILLLTVTVIICCMIILYILIQVFSNVLIKRIEKLKEKIYIVETGNFDITISSNSKDEIGELTNSFGKMVKNTNVLMNEVYRSKIVQKEAELKALQAQINPHFLYNILSKINWKAYELGAFEVCDIANMLSKFYRAVLNNGKEITSVRQELDNVKYYMQMQKILKGNSINFTMNIDESVLQLFMINLILQPILENCIEHGMKENDDKVLEISLNCILSDDSIIFIVEDNGSGIPYEIQKNLLNIDSRGYGLKNVNERIIIRYGNNYGLTVESKYKYGTKVLIKIPRRSECIE